MPIADFDALPIDEQADILTILAEAAQQSYNQPHAEIVTILDRDRIDAINVRAHGIINWRGEEHTFILEDGNWNGTVLHAWDDDKEFQYHVPQQWAIVPARDLVDKAIMGGGAGFLLMKWDAFMTREDVATIPGKYAYDRRVQPGSKVENYWKEKAASYKMAITTKEDADALRQTLEVAAAQEKAMK